LNLTGSKKNLAYSAAQKRELIDLKHPQISVVRQCSLLGLSRSGLYYQPVPVSAENLAIMRLLDEEYTKHPFLGVIKLTNWLKGQGYPYVGKRRVRRLLRLMGLMAIYPGPNLSRRAPGHKIYPYLLRGVAILRVNQVWSTDITYIRLKTGFVYLVAVIDWFSRYVLSFSISITLEADFCIEALQRALIRATPEIFNSDQGSQFTSPRYTEILDVSGVRISMDGKGRAIDNIFAERLWRSVKYEEVYLKDYETVQEAKDGIKEYFEYYNNERQHQSLDYQTPAEVYFSGVIEQANLSKSSKPTEYNQT
jgi:putative transposase